MSAWRRNRKRHVDQLLPLRVLYRDRHEKSLLTVDFIFLWQRQQRLPVWEFLQIVRRPSSER